MLRFGVVYPWRSAIVVRDAALGGSQGGGGAPCGCVAWGSGSHQHAGAPIAWRTASVGVGRNPVEAEWGTTGGGFLTSNCSRMTTQRECDLHTGTKGSCRWEGGKCASVFEAATALSYLADLVRGFWFSTQRGGENVSWRVLRKSVANARLRRCEPQPTHGGGA